MKRELPDENVGQFSFHSVHVTSTPTRRRIRSPEPGRTRTIFSLPTAGFGRYRTRAPKNHEGNVLSFSTLLAPTDLLSPFHIRTMLRSRSFRLAPTESRTRHFQDNTRSFVRIYPARKSRSQAKCRTGNFHRQKDRHAHPCTTFPAHTEELHAATITALRRRKSTPVKKFLGPNGDRITRTRGKSQYRIGKSRFSNKATTDLSHETPAAFFVSCRSYSQHGPHGRISESSSTG